MTTTKATIWVRIENCETEKVRIDAELDIDDLKKKLLGKDANKYRAIYQNTCLRSDAAIPIGTTFEQPISLCLEHAPSKSMLNIFVSLHLKSNISDKNASDFTSA
ncbi:unnamed protein product [Rotaria magnacalcarata]|uniref:Ubiquitin-like domain-containing protein n=1 Tax=Rotaria magnacalcarata TaxID=392030 RepID=A0A816CHL3_9BILA|nr:unnamed protein product [Rotaria magnacalcarata]CAF3897525.1 unnamed protein product [Rotaria magnacalcarata]